MGCPTLGQEGFLHQYDCGEPRHHGSQGRLSTEIEQLHEIRYDFPAHSQCGQQQQILQFRPALSMQQHEEPGQETKQQDVAINGFARRRAVLAK